MEGGPSLCPGARQGSCTHVPSICPYQGSRDTSSATKHAWSATNPPGLTFDGALPTLQDLWGTSPMNLQALLRLLRANPAKMALGGDLVDQGAPALTAGDLDQAADLLGWLVIQEDPLPLEVSFQGSLRLKVEVPALLSFFQVLPQQVLKVILELVVVHGAKEVPAHLAAARQLPGPALRQGHRGAGRKIQRVTGCWANRAQAQGLAHLPPRQSRRWPRWDKLGWALTQGSLEWTSARPRSSWTRIWDFSGVLGRGQAPTSTQAQGKLAHGQVKQQDVFLASFFISRTQGSLLSNCKNMPQA